MFVTTASPNAKDIDTLHGFIMLHILCITFSTNFWRVRKVEGIQGWIVSVVIEKSMVASGESNFKILKCS